jgi:hypothetical protein
MRCVGREGGQCREHAGFPEGALRLSGPGSAALGSAGDAEPPGEGRPGKSRRGNLTASV